MHRREFVVGLACGAATWSIPARAQYQDHPIRRIGILIPLAESDAEAQTEVAAFRDELRRLGWIGTRNVEFEIRWAAGDVEKIKAYAKELVELQPDVIVSRTTPATAALLRQTRTVPIVFVGPSDPVGAGFVASMSRPGGNATGFTNVEASLGGKWVELLRELNSSIVRIGVLFDPRTAPGSGLFYLRQIQEAARSIAAETVALSIHDAAEINRAVDAFARDPNGGLLVQPDIATHNNRSLIFSLATRHQLPAVFAYPHYVREGGLAAYGVDIVDLYRRAASYVDRILRGEKPDQLAVQAPVKFQLALNLKAARAIGLALPPMLVTRADEVIE
jgi:putative ABC transport system substrate-binding protein